MRPAGTYAATQGPRFESAAEIRKYDRDGADIVGMTGMPEACLARELGICYATIALVVNYAAGIGGSRISVDEIRQAHVRGMQNVNRIAAPAILRSCPGSGWISICVFGRRRSCITPCTLRFSRLSLVCVILR